MTDKNIFTTLFRKIKLFKNVKIGCKKIMKNYVPGDI